MDWDNLDEEMEWEGEDWYWDDDMPTPVHNAWWYDLTAEG